MWIIAIVILFVLLIGKFTYDSISLTIAMKKEGGMAVKYAELVDACLTCSNASILQETPTFISIGGKYTQHNITVNYAFWIQHTFNNKLIVKYVLKGFNIPQKTVQQWDFSQQMLQSEMIKAMRECLLELKPITPVQTDNFASIKNRYKTLIRRLKMEGTENLGLYNITELKDSLMDYSFKIEMKLGHYVYSIRFSHATGKLHITLNSTNFLEGTWCFPVDMDQSVMADKIEADIDAMVIKKHNTSDFYG